MRIQSYIVMLAMLALAFSVIGADNDGLQDRILWHSRVKASALSVQKDWNPLENSSCPLSVDDAVKLANKALQLDFPSISLKRTFITCKLSVTQMPKVEQDLPGTMLLTNPCFWQIEYLVPAPIDSAEPLVDVRYVVLFDRTVVRPTEKEKTR
jgi:hypothetical protein